MPVAEVEGCPWHDSISLSGGASGGQWSNLLTPQGRQWGMHFFSVLCYSCLPLSLPSPFRVAPNATCAASHRLCFPCPLWGRKPPNSPLAGRTSTTSLSSWHVRHGLHSPVSLSPDHGKMGEQVPSSLRPRAPSEVLSTYLKVSWVCSAVTFCLVMNNQFVVRKREREKWCP